MRVILAVAAIVLLGIALAAAYVGYRGHYCTAPQSIPQTSARVIRTAIQQWQAMNNSSGCPTIEQLVADKQLDTEWPTRDPWAQPYRLQCTAGEVTVSSAGPDRRFGTNDDIIVPRPLR